MKKSKITENLGLKIASIVAAFVLWLVVINIDDPVINRTYTGIPVEILNEDVIENEGKCYEVLGGTDTISVVVSAKRSVLDDISRDYIKATADVKALTFLDTIPIEVKVTRYADAVDSVTSRTENVQLKLENVVERSIPIDFQVVGEVEDTYLLSGINPKFETVDVSGPESLVDSVALATCEVNVEGFDADESVIVPISLLNNDGGVITNDKLSMEQKHVSVSVIIWATKEIPITCSSSGMPADGYSVVGTPITNPASVKITGRSAYLSSMNSIVIPPESVSVTGATETANITVDLGELLPDGIIFADDSFDGNVTVTVDIEANDRKIVNVPVSNITVENVPEGYKATIVDIGPDLSVEVQGKGDSYDRFDGTLALGTIDAQTMVPRNPAAEDAPLTLGSNDGKVDFIFPTGVYEAIPVYLEVIVEHDSGQ